MVTNNLEHELSTNFIEYAAAVNTDRAIPDARSGLKPVARRILYGAFNSGYTSNKSRVKSAKIVGDVMGQFHPHGDSSIYEAMVRLAQPWVMRYPLIDFEGNMGNQGGDGPAAMRYTESRLNKLAETGMLFGIKKGNVPFMPNYDESTEEPETLPAIFPNLLCNPNSGIGVAMACNFLPHNLNEVAQAIFDYMDGKEPTLPGPDFPTGGIVINSNDIKNILATGHGSVKVRGRYKIEKNKVVFYEVPYGVTIESLIDEIGAAAEEIPEINEIRNESNKKGLRIVVECETEAVTESVAKKLFAKTNLETSISYNMVGLVNKVPTELNLTSCIREYIKHNDACIYSEFSHDLIKAQERIEVVEGLLKALENIDNIIALIKKSKSSVAAKEDLIAKYRFTERQAKAIVEMRLGQLAGLEKIELNDEYQELKENIENINNVLASQPRRYEILRERLANLIKNFGDARRTELTNISTKPEDIKRETIIAEDVVVMMSTTGVIKRLPVGNLKTQHRNQKGAKSTAEYNKVTIKTNTQDNLLVFTDSGKVYKTIVDSVPTGTLTSGGTYIGNIVKMDDNERVAALTSMTYWDNRKYVVFFTKMGLIKKTELSEYMETKHTTGVIGIKLKPGDAIANIVFMDEEPVIVVTEQGKSIRFETKSIAAIGRNTAGVKSIKLNDGDFVRAGIPVSYPNMVISIFTQNGYGKRVKADEFIEQLRGGKGASAYPVSDSTGIVVSAMPVLEGSSVLINGKVGTLVILASEVPLLTRTAMGNMMNKEKFITSVTVV